MKIFEKRKNDSRNSRYCMQSHLEQAEIRNQQILKESMRKMRNCMAKIKIIRTLFEYRDDKAKFIEEFHKEEHLLQVFENDPDFKRNVCQAMPETKYYINKLLQDIEPRFRMSLPEKLISSNQRRIHNHQLKQGLNKGLSKIFDQVQNFQSMNYELKDQEKYLLNEIKNSQKEVKMQTIGEKLRERGCPLARTSQDVKNINKLVSHPMMKPAQLQ